MYRVGENETMAPMGADGAGESQLCGATSTLGAGVGVPSGASPSLICTRLLLLEPIPGRTGSLVSSRVLNLRHSGSSGSSRHLEGIDVNDDRFFNESMLSILLMVAPAGKLGFWEGTRGLNAGAQNWILEGSL
jgi:hypothetical protein